MIAILAGFGFATLTLLVVGGIGFVLLDKFASGKGPDALGLLPYLLAGLLIVSALSGIVTSIIIHRLSGN